MTYQKDWKGKLRVSNSNVFWNGKSIGTCQSFPCEGAKTSKGMVTNTIWVGKTNGVEFHRSTQTEIISELLRMN